MLPVFSAAFVDTPEVAKKIVEYKVPQRGFPELPPNLLLNMWVKILAQVFDYDISGKRCFCFRDGPLKLLYATTRAQPL